MRRMNSRLAGTSSGWVRSSTLNFNSSSRVYPVISQQRWLTEIHSSLSVRCAIPIAACSNVARSKCPGPPRGTAYSAVQPGTADEGARIVDSEADERGIMRSPVEDLTARHRSRSLLVQGSNLASLTRTEQNEFRRA